MARKGILNGLMDQTPAPSQELSRVDPAKPRYSKGAIGAVSQSIADLKARSIVQVDPRMIDDAGMKDRLERNDLEDLIRSLQTYGQQVPVLLRPNPNDPERYQVVYGRRRVAAMKLLQMPVSAMVRVLNDRELVIAQGQENSTRKELSFIERANFARQMRDAGYERKVICDALNMDKSLISRMLTVADTIPLDLIEAIGAAPSIGRDRWLSLADKLKGRDMTMAALGDTSDARFEAVFTALNPPKAPAPLPETVKSDGAEIARISRKRNATVITLPKDGFDEWLASHLAIMHRDWKNQNGN
ncbi:plasmid partitioning protein RepB [Marivivens donghaensis]|uniref:Plasmid partitioning protein RepB n=1 Tax=Marivivens donghaensis TaxID=1699413 RepID=A0ABX0W335_9RHOB|nr:plasmid partitioning protein RepB [Marivivens donghaensis]NIY73802.1 plasmid partitioning protein RepB [Marivivens donghaensis]